jgi:hypothetical protein
VLDVVDGVVLARNVVVKSLLPSIAHEVGDARHHTSLGLPTLRDHLEEHVHVHALVDI